MNFALFPVETTNIFPIANSVNGGQLVTEFNLKSRESVLTDPSVEYIIGPSFTHGPYDFYVSGSSNAAEYFNDSANLSSTQIEILAGRAVVNGHYVENLSPMLIDLAQVNNELVSAGEQPLSGDLSIGLKIMYSTESTMSGSILPETSSDIGPVYAGIQVVLLPTSEFLLPTSTTTPAGSSTEVYCGDEENQSLVTAHLLLATFQYINGSIVNIVQNPEKMQMLPGERISKINEAMSNEFVKKTGLNQNKLYVFAGKGIDPETGYDTWCSAEDSLIIWDEEPQLSQTAPTEDTPKQAEFTYTASGMTALILPHKQIDKASAGYTPQTYSGDTRYYLPRVMLLPLADYNAETPGTVNAEYTKNIKKVASRISELYNLPNGKQRGYIDILTDKKNLPAINPNWNVGDYILIGQDQTLEYEGLNSGARAPSTIYVLLPPVVVGIRYFGDDIGSMGGQCLATVIKSAAAGDEAPNTENFQIYSSYWGDLSEMGYRGQVNYDYFTYVYTDENNVTTTYYYRVAGVDVEKQIYSDQIYITSPVPFATQGSVGGFIDIDPTMTDDGYVYLDSEGHLRLLDYQLLRSGTLAYQLGEDFSVPNGLSIDEIQAYLDEYVNQRVAFPNAAQVQNAAIPNVINITIPITGDETGGTINIYGIDSRFDTSIAINILGNAGTNVTINISDCERVRINRDMFGEPTINLYRSGLYYDSSVLDRMNIIRDLKLWYAQFTSSDPLISVSGMTVSAIASGTEYANLQSTGFSYWSTTNPNDNHFSVALKSITLDSTGCVVGCGVLVSNDSTSNVQPGNFITHYTKFELPQQPEDTQGAEGLRYPASRMPNRIKVTGEFISAYTQTAVLPHGYVMQDTHFSLSTPIYDNGGNIVKDGEISFLVNAYNISMSSPADIGVWDPSSPHYFEGTTLY